MQFEIMLEENATRAEMPKTPTPRESPLAVRVSDSKKLTTSPWKDGCKVAESMNTFASRLEDAESREELGLLREQVKGALGQSAVDPMMGVYNDVRLCKLGNARDNPNRKRNETHETVLARVRRCAPPRTRSTDRYLRISKLDVPDAMDL